MSDYLILDLLFGIIVVLFAAIGLWRGIVKEIPITAAIFAGAALASSWANPWGGDLADLSDIRTDASRMIVLGVALVGTTIVLGYGGAALIGHLEITWGERFAGALLAGINGVLLLHYALDGVERFFTGDATTEALDQSYVARLLLREFGWVLVGAAVMMTLCLMVGWTRARRSSRNRVASASSVLAESSIGARGRPARLPREADSGKFEPVTSGFDARSGRYAADAPSVQQTIAMPPVDPERVANEGGRYAPPPSASGGTPRQSRAPSAADRSGFDGDEWIRRAAAPPSVERPDRKSDHVGDGDSAHHPTANGHRVFDGTTSSSWSNPAPQTPDSEAFPPRAARCPRCAGGVGSDDDFCPHCGQRLA